jgi:hypothetical protein
MRTEAESIKRLLAAASAEDQLEIKRAVDWRQKSFARERENPTRSTTADYNAARESLAALLARLTGVYFPDEAPEEAAERFKSRKEAWEWLTAQGGTVSRGKFYDDGKKGLYRVHADKSVSRGSVAEYLLRLNGQAPVADLALVDYSQEKQRLEVRKLDLEVSKLEIATRASDREWVRTEDHWAHLAASLALVKGNLEHFARLAAVEIVLSAGGDYNQGPQAAESIMELVVNRAFNELTLRPIDHGVFADEEEQPITELEGKNV